MMAENKPSTFVNGIEYTKPAQEKLVLQYRRNLNKFFLTGRKKIMIATRMSIKIESFIGSRK